MVKGYNLADRGSLILSGCLTLLQVIAVACMREGDAVPPPYELATLFRRSDSTNAPTNLVYIGNAGEWKYVLRDTTQSFRFRANETYCGITAEGVMVFDDLETKEVSDTSSISSTVLTWQFVSKTGPCYKELRASEQNGPEYLMQVFDGESSKCMHNFVVTSDPNFVGNPTKFQLKLHSNDSILGIRFAVILNVPQDSGPQGTLVQMMKYDKQKQILFEINDNNEILYEIIHGRTLEAYEWNFANCVMTRQDFVVHELPEEAYVYRQNFKKYIALRDMRNSNLNPSSLLYFLHDRNIVDVAKVDGEFLIFSKIETPVLEFANSICVSAFAGKSPNLVVKVVGSIVTDHSYGSKYSHVFNVKSLLEMSIEAMVKSPSSILHDIYEKKETFLFNVSTELEIFTCNSSDEVQIDSLGGNNYGIKPGVTQSSEIHERKAKGELIRADFERAIFVFGDSPNMVCKIQAVSTEKAKCYSPNSFIKLNASGVNFKFQKFEEIYDNAGDLYFTQTSIPRDYNLGNLRDKEGVLLVLESISAISYSLRWRVIVELSMSNSGDEAEMTTKTHPDKTLSEEIVNDATRFIYKIFKDNGKDFTPDSNINVGAHFGNTFKGRRIPIQNKYSSTQTVRADSSTGHPGKLERQFSLQRTPSFQLQRSNSLLLRSSEGIPTLTKISSSSQLHFNK